MVDPALTQPMAAARGKAFDCPETVHYDLAPASSTQASTTLTFISIRLQAHLPHKQASARAFSVRDPNTSCGAIETGFDAALYFGIAIGAMCGVGVLLFIRKLFTSRKARPGYTAIKDDE